MQDNQFVDGLIVGCALAVIALRGLVYVIHGCIDIAMHVGKGAFDLAAQFHVTDGEQLP